MNPAITRASDAPLELDLSRWRKVPWILLGVGGLGALLGAFINTKQFAYSWLLAFMFYLSLCSGAWFLVLVHHLFDASWSVPIRRVNEQMAALLPYMALLFIPIALLAPTIYPWMNVDPHTDHALHAKLPLFTKPMFYVVALFCLAVWWFFSTRLLRASLRQDETGAPKQTFTMRKLSAIGIFLFAITITLAAIMWMKALQHQWFSTMYGVYYFAGSAWLAIATVHLIVLALKRLGPLREVARETQFYFLGSLLLAFTVFYAYIHFSQYFIIWNGNIPEETFWYVVREKGSWWDVGMIIIFGHFFLPFLLLLRIDVKLSWLMIPLGIWAWLMHYIDLAFNILPVLHPDGFILHWIDLACMAFMGGLLTILFIRNYFAHPPYPQRDPRFAETFGVYIEPVAAPTKALPAGERAK